MADFTLLDLIDRETLQKIQDGFAKATGMAALTVDLNGPVTTLSNASEFCMKYTRESMIGAQRCNECDKSGGERALREGKANAYYCHGGLVDFAAPIVVNGEQIGSFIGGQVLPEPPDENKFRGIAKELGINPDEYVRAVKKVKIMPKKQIDDCADFLFTIAEVISKIGYTNYISKCSNINIKGAAGAITDDLSRAEAFIAESSRSFGNLSKRILELNKTSKKSVELVNDTKDTIKTIENVALNTRILGFNASIEASRAKESGKGFGVIAQEIRSLADVSAESVNKIGVAIQGIVGFGENISEEVGEIEEMIAKNLENLEKIGSFLQTLRNSASQISR